MIRLKGGMILKNRRFEPGDIWIKEDKIIREEELSEQEKEVCEEIDCEGKKIIPGLVDIHTHGCFGFDFCDGTEEALRTIASYEMSQGVMTFLPTSMTLAEEELISIFRNAKEFKEKEEKLWAENPREAALLADVAGIHAEGPVCSPEAVVSFIVP